MRRATEIENTVPNPPSAAGSNRPLDEFAKLEFKVDVPGTKRMAPRLPAYRTSGRITMTSLTIPHNTYVFVGDGRKALILRNEGDEVFLNLKVERVFKDQNVSTHEQGAERPGRSHPAVGVRRFAVDQTDWHILEEHKFATEVGNVLQEIVHTGKIKALIIVAPPRTLADLRRIFHKDVSQHIIAEINKDLTNEPVDQIEKHLRA